MKRTGFSMIEILLALVVIGIVVLTARVILERVSDGAVGTTEAAQEADRSANVDRLLRALVGNLEISTATDSERRFRGAPFGAQFHTWCEVPDGWLERCTAVLGIVELSGALALVLSLSTGEQVVVRRGFGYGELRYLRDSGGGGNWTTQWSTSGDAPIALGIVIDGELSLLRIGERG
jgi:prepilin-type N-terminal cleavage/methylation domain-containing protein